MSKSSITMVCDLKKTTIVKVIVGSTVGYYRYEIKYGFDIVRSGSNSGSAILI